VIQNILGDNSRGYIKSRAKYFIQGVRIIYVAIFRKDKIISQSISSRQYEIFMGIFRGRIKSRAKYFI